MKVDIMAILSILRVLMFLVASFKGEKRKTLTSLEQVLSFIYLGCNPLGDRTEGKRCEWKRKAFFRRPLGMVPFTTLLKFICLFALFLQRVMYFLQLFSLVPLFFFLSFLSSSVTQPHLLYLSLLLVLPFCLVWDVVHLLHPPVSSLMFGLAQTL